MTGSLSKTDTTWDNRLKYQILEVTPHLVEHLITQTQATVVHRQKESLDAQRRIKFLFYQFNGIQQFAYTLKGKVFALYRDDDRIGSH